MYYVRYHEDLNELVLINTSMGLHMLFNLSCSISHQKQLDFRGEKGDSPT